MMDGRRVRRLAQRLLDWYGACARDLPWRRTRDPYAIWISEIMLQQTRVATVTPYWKRWMRALPTVKALARSREERALKLWAGLGYYSRARNLRRAAQVILKEHNGSVPGEMAALRTLPGVGRYTAGAILSIAFGQPEPILDGNVTRVLARLLALEGNPREPLVARELWDLAGKFARATRSPGDLNQALMELGATVCTPRGPHCGECPLRRSCAARRMNQPECYPRGGRAAPAVERHWRVLLLENGGRWLVRRRPQNSVNAGLWEFPTLETANPRTPKDWAVALAGGAVGKPRRLGEFTHSITRYRIRATVWRAELMGRQPKGQGRWVKGTALGELAWAGAHRKALGILRAAG